MASIPLIEIPAAGLMPFLVFSDKRLTMQAAEIVKQSFAEAFSRGPEGIVILEPGFSVYQYADGAYTLIHKSAT